RYTARLIAAAEDPTGTGYRRPPWRGDGLTLSGSVLAAFGLPAPPRHPQSSVLVHLTAAS
ncbi:MAG: hypothetical protein M3140_05970, partial [Actinomycetota bacterium]|nr:hypothetical protein [Actinomycetota bacterium]